MNQNPKNTKLEEEIEKILDEMLDKIVAWTSPKTREPIMISESVEVEKHFAIEALTNLIQEEKQESYKKGYADGATAQYNEMVKASKGLN